MRSAKAAKVIEAVHPDGSDAGDASAIAAALHPARIVRDGCSFPANLGSEPDTHLPVTVNTGPQVIERHPAYRSSLGEWLGIFRI